jgi:hypothetical protein
MRRDEIMGLAFSLVRGNLPTTQVPDYAYCSSRSAPPEAVRLPT